MMKNLKKNKKKRRRTTRIQCYVNPLQAVHIALLPMARTAL
jgi:hypothetical protein